MLAKRESSAGLPLNASREGGGVHMRGWRRASKMTTPTACRVALSCTVRRAAWRLLRASAEC